MLFILILNNSIMETSVKQRLIQFVKYKGISQRKFESTIGVSNGFINNISKSIGAEKMQRIESAFPEINKIWLLTGEGDMLNNTTTDSSQTHGNINTLQNTIKYYPNVNGSMGGVQFLDDPNEMVCDITIPGYSDCKFAINAYGDSMYPLIKSGQIILMSEWSENFIDWGRIYLVVTKSGYRVIKRLYPGASDTTITCKSENPETNPPFEIEKSDINKVYLVKGWICRDAI